MNYLATLPPDVLRTTLIRLPYNELRPILLSLETLRGKISNALNSGWWQEYSTNAFKRLEFVLLDLNNVKITKPYRQSFETALVTGLAEQLHWSVDNDPNDAYFTKPIYSNVYFTEPENSQEDEEQESEEEPEIYDYDHVDLTPEQRYIYHNVPLYEDINVLKLLNGDQSTIIGTLSPLTLIDICFGINNYVTRKMTLEDMKRLLPPLMVNQDQMLNYFKDDPTRTLSLLETYFYDDFHRTLIFGGFNRSRFQWHTE